MREFFTKRPAHINGIACPHVGPRDWLVMPANAPHRLAALEPTRFVLTLFKRG